MRKFILLLTFCFCFASDAIKECDDAEKCVSLGIKHFDNKEYEKAFLLFKKACELGDNFGCNRVVMAYENGLGVEKNLELAQKYRKDVCYFN